MFTSGDRASWLNAVASKIMDGGTTPPSIEHLHLIVPYDIVTRENDGHVTAAAAFGEDKRKDYQAGWRVIIGEMITLLREQGFVGGNDQALSWIKSIDGTWKVDMPEGNRQLTVFGQRERRMVRDRSVVGERSETDGSPVGPPSLFEKGRMHPFELQVQSARGNITSQKFEIHPLATLMPSYTEAERESLRASIERDGVRMPIIIYQKKILDGRNRSYFASQFKKPVRITEFNGTEEEARNLVISLNLVRRHLSVAQQQLLGKQLFGEEARKEAAETYKKNVGRPKKSTENRSENFTPISEEKDKEKWFDIAARKAREAGLTNVTADGIRAMELVVNGAPETLAKVESGEIKTPAKAAAEARKEKNMPKATTAEGATNSLSIVRRLGKCIGHLSTILVDLEMPAGNMPEQISERIREIDRLNREIEQALRERRVIR